LAIDVDTLPDLQLTPSEKELELRKEVQAEENATKKKLPKKGTK
jgi:hypothetical protein